MRRLARPLLYVGIVAIVCGLAKVHAGYVADPPYDITGSSRFGWTVGYAGLLMLASYATGLPDLPRTFRQAGSAAVFAPAAASVAISVVQLLTGDALLPRFVVFGSALLVVPWALACFMLARGTVVRAQGRDRVVLVGPADAGLAIRAELDAHPERPASLLNQLTVAEAMGPGDRSKPLWQLVTDIGANVIVLDREALACEQVLSQAAALHENGVRVRTLSAFYEDWLGKLPVSELERASLLFDIREIHGGRYLRVKRVVDVGVGAVGLVPLLACLPFVLVGNAIANKGPLFYRQDRVGKQGRSFTILKLRTMRGAAAGADTNWALERDPRITGFGGLLRRSHLDELPQVVNIIRGDLSIVGPRPEQPRYVAELVEKLPFYDLRHVVRPGLTGWAQVNYGYAGDERDALEKLQYEFWYLRHQSLALDIRIIGRTIRSVSGRRGGGR